MLEPLGHLRNETEHVLCLGTVEKRTVQRNTYYVREDKWKKRKRREKELEG